MEAVSTWSCPRSCSSCLCKVQGNSEGSCESATRSLLPTSLQMALRCVGSISMLFRFGMAILRLCLNPIQTSRTGRLSSQEGQDKPELWCGRKRAQFAVEQIQIGYFNGFPRIGVFGAHEWLRMAKRLR